MLNKCAVANAFRWAFPETLGSYYIQDEIKDAIDVEFTPIEKPARPVDNNRVEVIQDGQQQVQDEIVINENFMPERDIEDLRGELVEFLGNANPEFFNKLGKDKVYMLDKVLNTKTLTSMQTIYDVVLKVK
jgi:hypothetical protein